MTAKVGKMLALLFTLGLLLQVRPAMADGSLVQAGFSAADSVTCGGLATAKVTVTGQTPPPSLQPSSIMLVLDVSGSMGLSNNLTYVKSASPRFIDLMDSGDGSADGMITGSSIGLVSFSYVATLLSPPTPDANLLKSKIAGLTASGPTNIADAINVAQSQLIASPFKRVMVILTDGNNNYPTTNPSAVISAAASAKAAGTEIFAIGFGKVNMTVMEQIASGPDHIYLVPTSDQLSHLFETTFAAVVGPSATQLQYHAQPSSDFVISAATASKGTVSFSPASLSWSLDRLAGETVTITYTLRHTGTANGARSAHQSAGLTWLDANGTDSMAASFADAQIRVTGCNLPPVANAGPDQTVPMTGPAGASVALDGTASTDDGWPEPLTYTWSENGAVLGTGAQLSRTFALGLHAVTLTVDDGQYAATSTVQISVVDRTPPTTAISLSGTQGQAGWYVSPVLVTVDAQDNPGGVGIDQTMVAIGSGAFGPYAGSFVVAAEGVTQVRANSTDRAGNRGDRPVSVAVAIDTAAPRTAASLTANLPGLHGWYRSPVSLTLSVDDAVSGVAVSEYQVNGGPWQTYGGPVSFSRDGVYDVAYRSRDAAGNLETTRHTIIRIDLGAPVVAITSPGAGVYTDDVRATVAFSATDGASGIDSVMGQWGLASVLSGQVVDLYTVGLGNVPVIANAIDVAGNTASASVNTTVIATYDSLTNLIRLFQSKGWIDGAGTVESLLAKLDAARKAHDRGDYMTEENILVALTLEAEALRDVHLFNGVAQVIIRDARWLMTHH